MKKFYFGFSIFLLFTILFFPSCNQKTNQQVDLNIEDAKIIKQFFDEALTNRETYALLDHLSNKIGHRLSG